MCARRVRHLSGSFKDTRHALRLVSDDTTQICDTQALDLIGRKLCRTTDPLCDTDGAVSHSIVVFCPMLRYEKFSTSR